MIASELTATKISSWHIHRDPRLSAIPGVVHGITRRVAGAGVADGNVGYSAPRDRADAWRMRQAWMLAAGLEAERIVVAYQVHEDGVAVVGRSDAGRGADPETRPIGQADSLVSTEAGVVLMTLHADCMPILLCDPVRRVVATVHAGWRGTVADVAGATVRTMVDDCGARGDQILAYLGPAIGGCCYEVGVDVRDAWSGASGDADALTEAGERWRFDLVLANRSLLERTGVISSNIADSGICTRCNGDEWFSHRGQGPATGRYAAFITLTSSGE